MTVPKKCRRVGVHNCEWCTTGWWKRIARRKERAQARRDVKRLRTE
jgi:hypothetical protein